MGLQAIWLRGQAYWNRHGARKTILRALIGLRNALRYRRDVLFCHDLDRRSSGRAARGFTLLRIQESRRLPEPLERRMGEFRAPKLLQKDLQRRFARGATLWCLLRGQEWLGFTWSLRGAAMLPYYFPLSAEDAHLFDDFVFPEHRGHGYNTVLLTWVLGSLASQGLQRAYIETAEWNRAERRSLAKAGFRPLGLARKRARGGICRVSWWLRPEHEKERSANP